VNELTKEEVAAYDAPFPSAKYKAGARAFPALVPTEPDNIASEDNRRAWEMLSQFEKPFLTAFSNRDPITRGGERPFQERVPGAKDVEHVKIRNAGHFLQEDKGEELAGVLVEFIRRA
jgi:haloalkane dehalogenase